MHEAGTTNKNTENQTCHKTTCPKRKAFTEVALRRYLILKIIPINTKQLAQNNTEFYFPGKIYFQRFKMLLSYVIVSQVLKSDCSILNHFTSLAHSNTVRNVKTALTYISA